MAYRNTNRINLRFLCDGDRYGVFDLLQNSKVMPHLKNLVDHTYKNDGCIAYDVAEDPFDSGLIRFSELWPDQVSLDNHLVAPHIEPWRTAAKQCGLIAREFTAYEILESRAV